MQIEDYFNFLAEDDIRIKGTRIGIETVLDEYIHNGKQRQSLIVTIRLHWNRSTLQSYIICKTEKKLEHIWRIIWNTAEKHEKSRKKSFSCCYSPA